jgi:pimeloyl-ACP methyl ester carboxylesterase
VINTLAALSWTGIARILPLGNAGPPRVTAIARAYVGTSFAPLLREGMAFETTMRVAGTFRDLGDRPLVVLTGARPYSAEQIKSAGLKPDQAPTLATVWRALHDDEATWSRRSRHQLVPDASHYIQFDRPDVVIAAVREVIAATARSNTPAARAPTR